MFDIVLYIIGSVTTVLCILLCILLFIRCKSKDDQGNRVELDNHTKEKPWSLGTWIAGVFVAGMGVGLMYAPGDLMGYANQGLNPVECITIVGLLNGAPVWALYSVMGLWYMRHMDSRVGKLAAMLSTVLGMSISLWTGMNTVAKFIGVDFPGMKFMLAAVTVLVAMFSAKRELLKGMSRLAFLMFVFAFLAVISTPLTEVELAPVSGGITGMFFKEYFLGSTSASWIFWFLSWTPTVSRWLAHISKGRTMREYITGTMVMPTILAFIWMTISWIYQDVITGFNLMSNPYTFIPCIIFIFAGMLLMTGTLDSDCKVFTEDLEVLSGGRIKQKSSIPYYGLFVMFVFSLFISGIITKPFAFNEYSSMIFMPLMIAAIVEIAIKSGKNEISEGSKNRNRSNGDT